MHSFYID